MSQIGPLTIGSKVGSTRKPRLILTVVDKFFFVGIFAGITGSAWLGARLWLMLSGRLAMSPGYQLLRNTHAMIQIYLFLGLFILGFSFHAVPRIMGGGLATPKWAPVFIALPIVGVLVDYLMPSSGIGIALIVLSFFIPSLFVLRLCRTSSAHNARVFGLPIACGLSVMAFGTLADPSNALTGLFIMWFGIGPIIFGTSQQFISGFLKGQKLSPRMSLIHIGLYVLSGAFAFLATSNQATSIYFFRAFAVTNIVITLLHYFMTGCYRGLLKPTLPINFTFGVAFLWSFIANLMLLQGPSAGDAAFHVLAIGWALTLVIGTSCNIISFMALKPVLPPSVLLLLLVVWQIAPIERGFPGLLPLAEHGPWILAALVVLVLAIWGGAMLIGISKLIRGQILVAMRK
jgi:hypothetical protein